MTIARKPVPESKATRFIAGKDERQKLELVRVLFNMDKRMLDKVDQAAIESGMNRSAWMIATLSERLRGLGL